MATIAGNFWPRKLDERRFPVTERQFATEPGVSVLVHTQQPAGAARGQLILVHGLEGSGQAGYARSLAQAALETGYAVHRFNMRSCGGTEAMSGKTLYHSGQTGDLLTVARQVRLESDAPLTLVGFSLGGNVVLKLGGELGSQAGEWLGGIVAVSTPIDLAACVTRLGRRSNYLYANRFVTRLKDRIRVKERLAPGLYPVEALSRVKTVYDFDDTFTAPSFGFGTADNYYATQSANQFLERIRIPALVVQAKDDPLIPFEVYQIPPFTRNPNLRLVTVEHGGHLGFVSRSKPRFWLDGVIIEWLEENAARKQPSSEVVK